MKISTHEYVLLSILLLIIFTTAIDINGDENADYNYMSKLLKALTPTPIGWSNNTHHCKWNGVVCDDQSNAVVAIKLPSSSLTGTLPDNLNSLSYLTHIDLHNNSLTGPLPALCELGLLETVYLGHNSFTEIPTAGCLTSSSIQIFNLSNNLNLKSWVFPLYDFGQSEHLQSLDLEATNMIGDIESVRFDSFPDLHTFVLSYNNLTGTLPVSLGTSKVKYLRLNDQGELYRFSGTIDVISSMSNLSQAWLQNNAFTGPIPNMSNCTHLFDLQLQSNSLIGLVPHSLLSLSSLKSISLGNNNLQGPIPEFHKGVKATWDGNHFCRSDAGPCDPQVMILFEIFEAFEPLGSFLSKGNNACTGELTGFIWSEAEVWIRCQRGKIVSIDLRNRLLTGSISPAFSNLSSLVNLTLANNNLTGSIPQSLATLRQILLLDISDNNLSGQIPKFSSSVKLNITGNDLLGQNKSEQPRGENATTSGDAQTRHPFITIILGTSILSVGFVILVLIICKHKRYHILVYRWIFKKTIKSTDHSVEDFIQNYNLSVPIKQYGYSEVKRMTNSFRDKLGQGGYGMVYKANLPDGREVAVKVINESKGNGEEFINEVASISRTSHVNIVSLLGFCYENKRALIYEFMSRGSLDKFILKSGLPDAICSLDWNALYQIAIGIARGLEYLHQGCNSRILHLDIKPQNILLDEDFCPKISDFGLAKICQKNDSIVSIIGTRGTIGYIAPEVFSRTYGGVSHKSDVYSYGMLIIEMIGGRKNYDTGRSCTSEMYFPDWIYKDLEQGNNLVNYLENSEEENDMVRKITMVSLWCIQTNPSDRPSMSKVTEMLQGPLESVPYPPKPFLYSPKIPSVQTSYVSSSNVL